MNKQTKPSMRAALLRLLCAAEGLDSLYDDESRAAAYADELQELSEAKDEARDVLNIGVPPSEVERANRKATEAL